MWAVQGEGEVGSVTSTSVYLREGLAQHWWAPTTASLPTTLTRRHQLSAATRLLVNDGKQAVLQLSTFDFIH